MKSTFFVVHFGDGGSGGSGKAYLLYSCENVDNCEQPLDKLFVHLFDLLYVIFNNY